MAETQTLTRWQRAAAVAVEGACVLPYLALLAGAMWRVAAGVTAPTEGWQAWTRLAAEAVVYGAVCAPLRLWRVTWYTRLCHAGECLPSLRPPRRLFAALRWRWGLWWRRVAAVAVGCAPSALVWGLGSALSRRGDGVLPLVCLLGGGLLLLGGLLAAAVWLCRYALAPLYLLDDCPASAALALSARGMRGRRCAYINFLGEETPRLLLCALIVPAVWVVPAFRRRRMALLLSWV